jgi:CBS domain-containing protein
MPQSIRDVMTSHPITLPATSPVIEAARAMRDSNIGDILVTEQGRICGVVTDRDIIVRGVAEGHDVSSLTLGDICSRQLTTLSPMDSVDDAVQLMREKALRRLPVVDGGKAVGIVSLGDLALTQNPNSMLGTISAAPSNH